MMISMLMMMIVVDDHHWLCHDDDDDGDDNDDDLEGRLLGPKSLLQDCDMSIKLFQFFHCCLVESCKDNNDVEEE